MNCWRWWRSSKPRAIVQMCKLVQQRTYHPEDQTSNSTNSQIIYHGKGRGEKKRGNPGISTKIPLHRCTCAHGVQSLFNEHGKADITNRHDPQKIWSCIMKSKIYIDIFYILYTFLKMNVFLVNPIFPPRIRPFCKFMQKSGIYVIRCSVLLIQAQINAPFVLNLSRKLLF